MCGKATTAVNRMHRIRSSSRAATLKRTVTPERTMGICPYQVESLAHNDRCNGCTYTRTVNFVLCDDRSVTEPAAVFAVVRESSFCN